MTTVLDVRVHSVSVGCDLCGWAIRNVPAPLATELLEPHLSPAVLAVDMTINGARSTWRRR